MKKPQHASGYEGRTTEAVKRALIDVAHLLGSYRKHIVVVGGLVPSLVTTPVDQPHVGTIDIDLALDAEHLRTDDAYAEVVNLLEGGGFHRPQEEGHDHLREFQMETTVDLKDGGEPVKVVLDLLIPSEAKLKKHRPPLITGLRTQRIDGLGLAFLCAQDIRLEGHDRKGRMDVAMLRIVRPEAFLVLKGLALLKRRESKDCYDIYYTIRNAQEGPDDLGYRCRALLIHEAAVTGFGAIRDKFGSPEGYGPGSVLEFLSGQDGREDEQIRQDAYGQVKEWVESLWP